jgi:N-acetylglucosamine-6-phosphate deacetylase
MLTITGDIVMAEGVVRGGAVVVDDRGKIGTIEFRRKRTDRSADIEAEGYLVLPGFIDMHVHGGGGADFMHGTPEAARQVARTHARTGTTSLLATTITASHEATDAAVTAARTVIEEERAPDCARIRGIHLEGPYICHARRGAQPAEHIRPPDVAEFQHWVELSGNTVREVTLAPEIPGAEALVTAAREAGVIVSLGHTDASAMQAQQGIVWGATQATHIFNAMRGLQHREPGSAGALLARPEVIAEVIADGIHLDPLIVRLIVSAKGSEGVVLITDAIAGASMPEGVYELGGYPVTVRDGAATLPDGTLAGSVLTMSQAFHNARRFAELSPLFAARITSANAARQLGIDLQVGSIEPGKEADFVIVEPNTGEVTWTVIGGKVAYKK